MVQAYPAIVTVLLQTTVILTVSAGITPRSERMFYHFHLHKCAGTRMCDEARFRNETIVKGANCNDGGDGPARRRSRVGGLYNEHWRCQDRLKLYKSSHITYFQTETLFNKQMLECNDDLFIAVTLREPLSRVVSHIRFDSMFIKDGVQHFRNASFTSIPREMPIYGSAVVNNYYIRSLLGSAVFHLPLGRITREHLTQAKAVLDNVLILILEEVTNREKLLECYADWVTAPHAEAPKLRDNKTGGKLATFKQRHMDKEWTAELLSLNKLDLELYDYAKGVSLQQLASCT
eukprot:m.29585 g.29585  ORF g.29585 m.29585 type:complete len:290 (-) comp11954_c0_seq1:175-1044(-)